MQKKEILDKLFEILNETKELSIQDIDTKDKDDLIDIYLIDGTRFSVIIKDYGTWELYNIS